MVETLKDTEFSRTYSEFYEDGTTMYKFSTIKRDGEEIKHGECKKYYANGKIEYEGYYKNGVKDGKWITYYNTGRIKVVCHYKDGKMESKETYNDRVKIFNEKD